jgi:hypothetical protein
MTASAPGRAASTGTLCGESVAHHESAVAGWLKGIWRLSGTVGVGLLGRVGVEHGDLWLDGTALPGRRQGPIVLTYLALHRHPVSRDDLADLRAVLRHPGS